MRQRVWEAANVRLSAGDFEVCAEERGTGFRVRNLTAAYRTWRITQPK
jgi:hypothetical protein